LRIILRLWTNYISQFILVHFSRIRLFKRDVIIKFALKVKEKIIPLNPSQELNSLQFVRE